VDLYFKQLKAGRDFGRDNPAAQQMNNFMYLVGDRAARKAVVVDLAWDVPAVLAQLDADGMQLTGALVTHYHPDHVGGHLFGHDITGLAELMKARPVKAYVNKHEAEGVLQVTGLSKNDLHEVDGGHTLQVGEATIHFLHTPGHTPGSQCFLVDGRLVAGDTLFLEGCGRTDLPGSDPIAMYDSINNRLSRVPDDAVLFPGHLYSADPSQSMGETRKTNYVFRPRSLDEWTMMFGGR